MSESGRPITEEEVHAYVDGRLDEDRGMGVSRYLQAHPEAAARVAAYGEQRQALRAAFEFLAAEPVPPSLDLSRLLEERLMRRPSSRWQLVAAVVAALWLGGIGGWLVGRRPPSGLDALAQEAAASYAVYVADKGRPVELAAEQRGDLVRWLTLRLNRPVVPPDLSAAGYRFLGGRLVATGRGAAALFVYESGAGSRLAVFLRPMGSEQSIPIEAADIGDSDGCIWIDNGVGYIVTGAEPYGRLLELSRQVRQQAQARS